MHFKNLERKPERKSPKRTVSAGDKLVLLQIVLEPNTRQCASEDVEPQRRVACEIPHRLAMGTTLIGEGNECQRRRWALKGDEL